MSHDATLPPPSPHDFQSPSHPLVGRPEIPQYETPPHQSRLHPYSRPTSSSPAFGSPDPSPYAGLTKKQRKAFKAETKKIDDQVQLWSLVFAHFYGQHPDHDALINSWGQVCDSVPQIRTFSVLTTKDYRILNPGERGLIICDHSVLASKLPIERIPADFWRGLQTLRRTCSRTMEMGVRQIIGYFLAYAVDVARELFNMERLVVHSEIEIPVVDIPRIGKVHGPMDFLTCPAAGTAPMG